MTTAEEARLKYGGEQTNGTSPALEHLDELRRYAITTEQIKKLPPPAWIIDGVLQADSLAEVYGKPGCGKSFLAAAWSQHIATGLYWQSLEVRPTPAVYVAAEGATGMGARIEAWEEHHAVDLTARRTVNPAEYPVTWLPMAVNLGVASWGEAIGNFAAENEAGLVVFDTRARNTVGIEENSATAMGEVVANLDAARRLCGACMLLVHHSNAFGDKSRGSTAIEGAVDTEVSVKKADDVVTVKVEKQKNGPDGMVWQFRPKPVGASIVLEGVDLADDGITAAGWKLLDTLREIYIDEPVSFTRWMEASDVNKSTVARQAKQLVTHGLVEKVGRLYQPVEEPEPDATDAPF